MYKSKFCNSGLTYKGNLDLKSNEKPFITNMTFSRIRFRVLYGIFKQ